MFIDNNELKVFDQENSTNQFHYLLIPLRLQPVENQTIYFYHH